MIAMIANFLPLKREGLLERGGGGGLRLTFSLYVLFSQFRQRDVFQGIYILSFHNYAYICTRIGQHLKETVLLGITGSRGLKWVNKNHLQAKKVYSFICSDHFLSSHFFPFLYLSKRISQYKNNGKKLIVCVLWQASVHSRIPYAFHMLVFCVLITKVHN